MFVDSNKVAAEIVQQVGVGSIAGIYNAESTIKNYPSDVLPDEIPVPNIEKLSQSGGRWLPSNNRLWYKQT